MADLGPPDEERVGCVDGFGERIGGDLELEAVDVWVSGEEGGEVGGFGGGDGGGGGDEGDGAAAAGS